jgi:hypothetical protein
MKITMGGYYYPIESIGMCLPCFLVVHVWSCLVCIVLCCLGGGGGGVFKSLVLPWLPYCCLFLLLIVLLCSVKEDTWKERRTLEEGTTKEELCIEGRKEEHWKEERKNLEEPLKEGRKNPGSKEGRTLEGNEGNTLEWWKEEPRKEGRKNRVEEKKNPWRKEEPSKEKP